MVGLSVPATAAYAHWVEPGWLAVRRHSVQLLAAPAPAIRMVHLSDLHWSEWVTSGMIRHAVARAIALRPDFICITGDFVTGDECDLGELSALLRPLADAAPTVATLGNHDGGAWTRHLHHGFSTTQPIRGMLADAGIQHLDNVSESLTVRGREVRVCGVGDLWAGEFRPAKILTAEAAEPTLVLSHNPDTKESLQSLGWHLMLSGHTHGGQLRVPLFGALFAPVKDRRFLRGVHRWENRWLAVSAGVGNLHGLRFNCRPEISEFILT